jgi:ATP/maltotriose-dependent transcriptional regulator MalT
MTEQPSIDLLNAMLHRGAIREVQQTIEAALAPSNSEVLAAYVIALWYTPDHKQALHWLAAQTGAIEPINRALLDLGLALIHQDFGAIATHSASLLDALPVDAPLLAFVTHHSLAAALSFRLEKLVVATEHRRIALEIAERLQNAHLISMAAYWSAELATLRGDYVAASQHYQRGLVYPDVPYAARLLTGLAIDRARAGEIDSAEYLAQIAMNRADELGDIKARLGARRDMARVRLLANDINGARAALDNISHDIKVALADVRFHNFYQLYQMVHAQINLEAGDLEAFNQWWHGERQLLAIQAQENLALRLSLQLLEAEFCFRSGRHSAALRTVDEHLALVSPRGVDTFFGQLLRSRILWIDNRDAALMLLRDLITKPQRAGLFAASAIQSLLREVSAYGLDVAHLLQPSTDVSHVWESHLTRQEHHILAHLADAYLTNKDIATALNLSVNTVKWHARNIYTKLGVSNRREAIRTAKQRGWL